MPFDYGSQDLRVANPFRVEGLFAIGRGSVTALLGVTLLLSVRDQLLVGGTQLGWLQLGGALVLLGAGFSALAGGILKVARFYVGRNIPSDLAPTGNAQHHPYYTGAQLKEMLMGRKNITFLEPQSWLERSLLTAIPYLLYLPAPLRTNLLRLSEATFLTATLLLALALALFSGSAGLTSITRSAVGDWLGWLVTGAVITIWWHKRPRHGWLRKANAVHLSVGRMVQLVVITILTPAVLTWVNQSAPLPAVPVAPTKWLACATVLALAAVAYGMALALFRMPPENPATDVSEFREAWEVSLHPMDIFRAFDMGLADNRFMEIPNRVYENYDPALLTHDSKGNFRGSVVQEVQPIPQPSRGRPTLDAAILGGQVVGQTLLLGFGVSVFLLVRGLTDATTAFIVDYSLAALLSLLFGSVLVVTAHAYAAEVTFVSHLVHFFANGTFNRSKISTGMAITDSTRSENEVIRSSLTPWLLCSKVVSSTFAVSGSDNLEQNRCVLEMRKDDAFLHAVVEDLRRFIGSRQLIADVHSAGDMAAAGGIHVLNQATRAPVGGALTIAGAAQRRQLSDETGGDDADASGG